MDLFELSDIDEQNKKFKRIKELEKLIKKYQDSPLFYCLSDFFSIDYY